MLGATINTVGPRLAQDFELGAQIMNLRKAAHYNARTLAMEDMLVDDSSSDDILGVPLWAPGSL